MLPLVKVPANAVVAKGIEKVVALNTVLA